MIPFSRREMKNAWWRHYQAARQINDANTSNTRRLLLFYAVECGLKALIMVRNGEDYTGGRLSSRQFRKIQHDINELLDTLRAGKDLNLPVTAMNDLRSDDGNYISRQVYAGDYNQMWRYGGSSQAYSDQELEDRLERIATWVGRELA
ncbi:hypothetical protein [Heliophilum fasciatum]|uniref:HEPN domain-containing protein n=1 Tax=Heliophilum fasciatum TaxID=35700 RepID=A0A4R2RWC2_9FIRM|nr:hypothetical protein [Heliophilum fasciatum]MCW2276787.1 hypothetical protein [Heliophilum fasciatum]TCP68752.1 hypothetical protein EDD73_102148 [Heliophilum fasciatum]